MHTGRLRRLLERLDARIPDRLPRLRGTTFHLCRILWILAFVAAIVGPLMGLYYRYQAPTESSNLILGSRAGIAVAPQDATLVRYTVGPYTARAGVRAGDRIVAVAGVATPEPMPITGESEDAASIAISNLLFESGTERIPLTFASPDGSRRQLVVTTGEHHIDAAAGDIGISPKALNLSDLVPALIYPVLIWVAFLLYTRNADRPLPVLLSFGILLSMAAEQPSSTFLSEVGVPRTLNIVIFDLANILLLAAILLFPDARLKPRRILLPLSLLFVLIFLQGIAYQAVFVLALAFALTIFVKRLRTETGVQKQQLKLLFLGLALYPFFRSISVLIDLFKWNSASLAAQMWLELGAGVTLGLAVASLPIVLFTALRSYRLYDADGLFTRSAMVAAITLTITAFFAITSAFLEQAAETLFGQHAGPWPSLIAAAAAVLLIKPAQRRIHDWSERRFQRELFELRTELPKRMDDLRETASSSALLQEALARISTAFRATRSAAVIKGKVEARIAVDEMEVRKWLDVEQVDPLCAIQCDRSDATFPVRLPLPLADGASSAAYLLIGPRPDGSMYSRDERAVLIEIAEPIARAVDVARQRQAAVANDRRWKLRQEKRVREIEQQLAALLARVGAKIASG